MEQEHESLPNHEQEASQVLEAIKTIESAELARLDEINSSELTKEDIEAGQLALQFLHGEPVDLEILRASVYKQMIEITGSGGNPSRRLFINVLANKVAQVWLEAIRKEQQREKGRDSAVAQEIRMKMFADKEARGMFQDPEVETQAEIRNPNSGDSAENIDTK